MKTAVTTGCSGGCFALLKASYNVKVILSLIYDSVSLSYEEYKNMKARIELLEILAEAEDDARNNRTAPIADTFDDLRAILRED